MSWKQEVPFWRLSANAAAVPSQMRNQMQLSKKEWLKRLVWMPEKCPMCCCQTGKLSTSSNCTKWHRQRQKRPSSPPDGVSWSLRSSPSQTEECINCFAEFLSVFMDNFPHGPPVPHPSSTSSVCFVASSENIFTKCVWAPSSAADAERGLPDEVSRGTRAAFCPDKQMHSAPGTLCLQLVPPINAICVRYSASLSFWRERKSPWRGNAREHFQFCCHGIIMEPAQQNGHIA